MSAEHTVGDRAQFICGYRLEFDDGGEPEAQILHKGTRKECEEFGELFPAVAYNGPRPNPRAFFVVVPHTDPKPADAEACDHCDGTGEREVTIGGDGYGNRCCGLSDVPVVCGICDGKGWL